MVHSHSDMALSVHKVRQADYFGFKALNVFQTPVKQTDLNVVFYLVLLEFHLNTRVVMSFYPKFCFYSLKVCFLVDIITLLPTSENQDQTFLAN